MDNQQQPSQQERKQQPQSQSQAQLKAQQSQQQPSVPPKKEHILIQIFYPIQNILKLYFLVASVLLLPYTDKVGLLICIMAVLRQLKTPKLNKQYLIKFLQTQFGLNIVYILISLANPSKKTYLFYAPLFLHFLLGTCEYLNLKHATSPLTQAIKPIVKLRDHKNSVLIQKGKIEVYYFIATLCSVVMSFSKILPTILLGQFLYFKHKVSAPFKWTMYEIRSNLDPVFNRIPLVSTLYQKVCNALGGEV